MKVDSLRLETISDTDLRLRVCFTSGSLWLGQAHALISGWKRHGLLAQYRFADLEDHEYVTSKGESVAGLSLA